MEVKHGKRGKPIKKDYQDSVKKYLNDPSIKYRAESILNNYGIKCVRLPPYHPELNAIGTH